jgi:hypothetical protein
MMRRCMHPIAALAATIILSSAASFALAASATPPAATAFLDAWAKVDSYTDTIVSHETDGKTTQDRTYHFAYLKPHYARIDIVDGPGKGGGAVWQGGDTVHGHQGGFLSGIKLQVSIHDSRAVSLRGDTIDYASFESMAQQVRSAKEIAERHGDDDLSGGSCVRRYQADDLPVKGDSSSGAP